MVFQNIPIRRKLNKPSSHCFAIFVGFIEESLKLLLFELFYDSEKQLAI
ncbi:MAG: hypothetical protein XD81_1451 [Bacteroidetes bacterium 38_7]|jgi:RsiW-degrading membrane proteinase PrsW (M82 family)|nr:MAG: hypothetical protein XD81_1451 [Bacteroidetes bacterium 38_7]